MKKFLKENWFKIIIIILTIMIILSLFRMEDELRMIHQYTFETSVL